MRVEWKQEGFDDIDMNELQWGRKEEDTKN